MISYDTGHRNSQTDTGIKYEMMDGVNYNILAFHLNNDRKSMSRSSFGDVCLYTTKKYTLDIDCNHFKGKPLEFVAKYRIDRYLADIPERLKVTVSPESMYEEDVDNSQPSGKGVLTLNHTELILGLF